MGNIITASILNQISRVSQRLLPVVALVIVVVFGLTIWELIKFSKEVNVLNEKIEGVNTKVDKMNNTLYQSKQNVSVLINSSTVKLALQAQTALTILSKIRKRKKKK